MNVLKDRQMRVGDWMKREVCVLRMRAFLEEQADVALAVVVMSLAMRTNRQKIVFSKRVGGLPGMKKN